METIKPKKIISCLPAILFLMGILFFSFSPLTVSRVVTVQNDIFIIFFRELKATGLISAILLAFSYLWANVLWIVFIFLVLISFGYIIYVFLLERLDLRVVIVSQILFMIATAVLTSLSIVMLLMALSLFLGIIWLHKTFEPRKNDFSTGYSVLTSRLGLMNVLLSVGIFLSMFLNLSVYEQQISESNMELMKAFMPEMTKLKEVQKKEVKQITQGFQYALTERYEAMPEETQTECKSMYDGLMQGLEGYGNQSIQKIESQELGITGEEIMESVPFFGILSKISPLLTAITIYALLSVLTPLFGIFGGVVYSLMKKSEVK